VVVRVGKPRITLTTGWLCVCVCVCVCVGVVISCEALVDGLRQGPSSFASLVYHSQLAYEFVPLDGRPRAVRFRLIPRRHDDCDAAGDDDAGSTESGRLDASEQDDVAVCGRRHGDSRPVDYLRQEFIDRLQRDEPVSYQLQMQINDSRDRPHVWNPQLVRIHSVCIQPGSLTTTTSGLVRKKNTMKNKWS